MTICNRHLFLPLYSFFHKEIRAGQRDQLGEDKSLLVQNMSPNGSTKEKTPIRAYIQPRNVNRRCKITHLMMVRVVMSRATLTPCLSLALSMPLLHPTTYRGPFVALTITVEDRKKQNKQYKVFL